MSRDDCRALAGDTGSEGPTRARERSAESAASTSTMSPVLRSATIVWHPDGGGVSRMLPALRSVNGSSAASARSSPAMQSTRTTPTAPCESDRASTSYTGATNCCVAGVAAAHILKNALSTTCPIIGAPPRAPYT